MFTDVLAARPLGRALARGAERIVGSPLAAVATAPHGVDRYLEQVKPSWAVDRGAATVVASRPEAPGVTTLVLRPGRGWTGARAGQHVTVGVEINGRRRTRSFSVASSEHRTDGCIEITVKTHAAGLVSRHLVERTRPGDLVTLSPPAGDFTLPEPRPERLLLISGGSGITPVMALLRTLVDEGHRGHVTFLHYARTGADVIFAEELAAIDRAQPSIDVHVVLTAPHATPSRAGLEGRFCRPHLTAVAPSRTEAKTYVCGPAGLVDSVVEHWSEAGMADRLHVERFSLTRAAPTADAVGGEVRFTGADTTLTSDGRTLLEQAEGAGLAPAFGCRMGVCHTCTRPKQAGVVRDLRTDRLSSADAEPIQICVSVPVGDVAVDL